MVEQRGGKRTRWRRPDTKINNIVSSIHSLPRELVVDILAKVAAYSLNDLFNAKLSFLRADRVMRLTAMAAKITDLSCCREWSELGDNSYVYKHASLAKLPIVQGWKPESAEKKRKRSLFLQKCIDAGNLEALYRKEVVDYLQCQEPAYGLQRLKEAANAGSIAALYAVCIISIFLGGEYKKNGIIMLSGMKDSKEWRKRVRKARHKLINIIKMIWVRNSFLVHKKKPICCTVTNHHIKNLGWGPIDSDDENLGVECASCKCDIEIFHIYEVLPHVGV